MPHSLLKKKKNVRDVILKLKKSFLLVKEKRLILRFQVLLKKKLIIYNILKDLLDITELSRMLNLVDEKSGKPLNHILRYWEKEFKDIKPTFLSGKRRYYNKKQVEKIKFIKFLLKDKGLTIKGVKMFLKEEKNIDGSLKNTIEKDYFKNKLQDKSKNLLKKLKGLKKYG